MPFTNEELLRCDIAEERIAAMKGTDSLLDTIIQEVDSFIAIESGIPVPENVADAPPLLTSVANALVIWRLLGRVSNVSREELEYRETKRDYALNILERIKKKELNLLPPLPSIKPQFSALQRIEDW